MFECILFKSPGLGELFFKNLMMCSTVWLHQNIHLIAKKSLVKYRDVNIASPFLSKLFFMILQSFFEQMKIHTDRIPRVFQCVTHRKGDVSLPTKFLEGKLKIEWGNSWNSAPTSRGSSCIVSQGLSATPHFVLLGSDF